MTIYTREFLAQLSDDQLETHLEDISAVDAFDRTGDLTRIKDEIERRELQRS